MKILSYALPLPSILICILSILKPPCELPARKPLSPDQKFKTLGFDTLSALSSALRQNSLSNVFDNSHTNTYRLYQSIMAARYRNPLLILVYVISALHT